MKEQKRNESELATKLVGIIVTIIFIQKSLKFLVKTCATQCFFTDHLKHKTVNTITFRSPSANPCQVCAH